MSHDTDICLFEYGDPYLLEWTKDKVHRLEIFLEEVWENRKHSGMLSHWYTADDTSINQSLVKVIRKRRGGQFDFFVKAQNYVGILRFEEYTFHILPKVFENNTAENVLSVANAHLLWWLTYSKRLKLPKHIAGLAFQKCDFLEVLTYLFATYVLEQLNRGVYQTYRERNETTSYVKGQFLSNEYVCHSLVKGNVQEIHCRYEKIEVDNLFNQIIKSVCLKLSDTTHIRETANALQKVLKKLSPVSDVEIQKRDCHKVTLNRMFGNYNMVLDYCKMFLAGQQTTGTDNGIQSFAFLIPMEKVFEDFVYGFLKSELQSTLVTKGQHTDIKLTNCGKFRLKPDLHVTNPQNSRVYIGDCKYKLLSNNKKGVLSSDMYQMLAYAIRHNVNEIRILYPAWKGSVTTESVALEIEDKFADNKLITVEIHSLEVVTGALNLLDSELSIKDIFERTRINLISTLSAIFN